MRASKETYLARAIDALVSPAERADLERAIGLLERLAAADLSRAAPAIHRNHRGD